MRRGGGGRGRNRQVDKCRRGPSRLQRFVSKAFGAGWITSADISSYTLCWFVIVPDWTCVVFSDGLKTGVFSVWTFGILCAARLAQSVLSNCKALKVTIAICSVLFSFSNIINHIDYQRYWHSIILRFTALDHYGSLPRFLQLEWFYNAVCVKPLILARGISGN